MLIDVFNFHKNFPNNKLSNCEVTKSFKPNPQFAYFFYNKPGYDFFMNI